ncbi:MAG TPA: hypothetical protein VKB84_02245 [Candidatus Binataceae bacterium]|nr:hypothetical protein [Candidatus Binataceae bacterium]
MSIWAIVNPAVFAAGLGHSGGAASAVPVPIFDLVMTAVAIAVWAAAFVGATSWLRVRERAAARAHIRSIRSGRGEEAVSTVISNDPTSARRGRRYGTHHSWPRPIQQV